MSSSLKRVVMRTSVGWEPPVKGCTLTSTRPLEMSKPSHWESSLLSSACFSTLTGEERNETSGSVPERSSLSRGTIPAFSSSNISSIREEVMPGSNSSSSTSYAKREGSIMAAFCRDTATHCSRYGANLLKSDSLRASTHACIASVSSSAIRLARSFVTDAFRLKSRAAIRTVARWYSSNPLRSDAVRSLSTPPSWHDVALSCRTPARAAFCLPRAEAASGGIITISSQLSSPAVPSSAAISRSCSASTSNSSGTERRSSARDISPLRSAYTASAAAPTAVPTNSAEEEEDTIATVIRLFTVSRARILRASGFRRLAD
mmetsp:Transcript_24800/g.44174  ORF Transcript_24800/g.44174 Transcript_24800/m.44174 type:complete len:318 (+) Transcript_24800:3073-4026(+)